MLVAIPLMINEPNIDPSDGECPIFAVNTDDIAMIYMSDDRCELFMRNLPLGSGAERRTENDLIFNDKLTICYCPLKPDELAEILEIKADHLNGEYRAVYRHPRFQEAAREQKKPLDGPAPDAS